MNLVDVLRGLARRWYVVLPGLILAVALAGSTLMVVKPGYERVATQLLLPGEGTIPEGTSNPYLFLGGLTQAADIVTRVMNSEEGIGAAVDAYPGTEVEVVRDPTMSGPVIKITVTAQSDAAAEGSLEMLLGSSARILADLQEEQDVATADRMTISTLTQDSKSTLEQKTRILMSGGVGLVIVVLTLLVASLIDGLIRRARRSGRRGITKKSAPSSDVPGTAIGLDSEVDADKIRSVATDDEAPTLHLGSQ